MTSGIRMDLFHQGRIPTAVGVTENVMLQWLKTGVGVGVGGGGLSLIHI